ncbi:leukemia inhibitory factor receptor-like [Xyrichtys novacula]|uniref:Leukemia inhibitory factor receptor-like n=1 Tax=Xyrichtys novacula TaxID=13765 RepID=A0AAV1GC97_XYRNO|nr:leukemia inhibitory factor receptor-like [Xyrichtys novacula]
MILWLLLLVSLFCGSSEDKTGKADSVTHCGPQNLKLNSSDQTIFLTWEDDSSCSAVRDVLIYKLVVLIADQEEHHDEVTVMPEQIGSTHSWKWTSNMPLECASHTVRISFRYNNHTSLWMQEKTLSGKEVTNEPQVYPKDNVFMVGSKATFCCILPAGQTLKKMYLDGHENANIGTTMISNQTHILTVILDRPTDKSCTRLWCQSSDYGVCAYVGYPPRDHDLQCETHDLKRVNCCWKIKNTHLHLPKFLTKYYLNGRRVSRPVPRGSVRNYCQEVEGGADSGNWTLTAENKLGKLVLTDRADLLKRVHMFAPLGVSASAVNARNVSLTWEWTVQGYHNLDITCQVNVSSGETNTVVNISGVGLSSAVVVDLTPNWIYSAEVRCGTTQHLWKWGNWSKTFSFRTKGDVPDALDVWMRREDNQTLIVWKELLANQSHGNISEYEVSWVKTTEREHLSTANTGPDNHSVSLSLDLTEEYIVTVTAKNRNGSSSPSTITIPRLRPDGTAADTSRILGNNGGFELSWSASPVAGCGYIVDWCPTSESCRVEWLKVPPNETKAQIFSKNFRDGQRYSLSVYACTHGAPVLLERREGYVKEQRIKDGLFKLLRYKQLDLDVQVSWDPVPLASQSAFIQGYVLYGEDKNNRLVCNVSTGNPNATSLMAKNLAIDTYTFTVKAMTAVGDCGDTVTIATLNSLTDELIKVVSISLVSIFCLLCLITFLCYRNWSCIKHKVYPPIPKPVLTDKWLTTVNNGCYLHEGSYLHSEADIMDVPELFQTARAPVEDYDQESISYTSVQPLNSYYNLPMKNCVPQPSTLLATDIPPTSRILSPPFRGLFPNPSYKMTLEQEYQPCSSPPELHGGTYLEKSCDGYQPQIQTTELFPNLTNNSPDSSLFCVSSYVLLPQSSHT